MHPPIRCFSLALVLILCAALFAALAAGPAQAVTTVTTAQELLAAVDQANAGGDTEILLVEGTYTLDRMLWVEADNVVVRSASGNRDAVIIEGHGMNGDVTHIFNVAGSNILVQDLTMGRVSQHAFQTQPEAQSPVLRNLHIVDTGEQMVKIAFDDSRPDVHTDKGLMERCLLEYTAGIGPQYYIGGIDCHAGRDWVVRNNVFFGIRSPDSELAEFAIHFWSWAEGTIVAGNLILNCDRGIGFGMGDRGHVGGAIFNNMIQHDASPGDAGIVLESSKGTQVYNNTVMFAHDYPNAIEYRFPDTKFGRIANNLCNRAITARDGGMASEQDNLENADPAWFVNVAGGDLHLASAVPQVVDQGAALPNLIDDFDGDPRPLGPAPDIGADEYAQ